VEELGSHLGEDFWKNRVIPESDLRLSLSEENLVGLEIGCIGWWFGDGFAGLQ